MKNKILKTCSYILAVVGIAASGASCVGCMWLFFDEPETPNCMIEK